MALIVDNTVGLERVGRAVLLALSASVNAELATQTSLWAPLDAAFYGALSQPLIPCVLEQVPAANFGVGSKPSLINSPTYDRYPHVSVIPSRVRPSGMPDNSAWDQFYGYDDSITIEILVKAGPYPMDDTSGYGEDMVHRRLQRTVDSVAIVLSRARTLGGIVPEIPDPMSVDLSEVFTSNEHTIEQQWFWQGASMEYTIPRIARAY